MKRQLQSISKNTNKTFLWIAFLLLGCNDYLDVVPDNRVALTDLDKAAQLLTNAYSVASPAFTDWMTDDFNFTIGTTIRPSQGQLYKWEDVTAGPEEEDSPDYFWYETYKSIAHANEVLKVIDELEAKTEKEKTRKNAIKAEALLTRAYGHFMLVNLFAKTYDQQSASSDKGVPYIKTPETVFLATYERISVKRVYSEIEDDLLEGIDLLNDSFYNNSGKYHFNRNAALAFASRFYLFKGDMIRCKQYCDEMFQGNPGNFIRDMTSTEYNNAKSSITGYPQLYSSPDEPANLLLMRKISLVQRTDYSFGIERNYYSDLFGANPFGSTDEREDPALIKGRNALFPVRYENLFERSSINSNSGTPYHIGIMFRGEEVLFNRIEANIYLNKIDDAIADLQVLSERRYSDSNILVTMDLLRAFFGATNEPSFGNQDVLLNYLLLERQKEFIGQGMRWFDVKRYGMTVEHQFQLGGSVTLESDDLRKVLQIPKSAIDVGGLAPNPR